MVNYKTIKNISVKMTFTVSFKDLGVSDEIYNKLIDAANDKTVIDGFTDKYNNDVYYLLNDIVNSDYPDYWNYQITKLEK